MLSIPQHVVALLGRVLLSAIFLASGVNHILSWDRTLAVLGSQFSVLPGTVVAERSETLAPVLLTAAVAFLIGGGLMLLLGMFTRLGAVVLILFLIPATLMFHNFWVYEPSEADYTIQMIHFMKNLGLMGGLLAVLAFGPGWFAADTFIRRE